ncbi:MAG: DUF2207 domain-containing protein [Alphaproteobacteria bacterium]|nr:DUF2207 domain-containing protein [Alphaproteobacteria bacterium]
MKKIFIFLLVLFCATSVFAKKGDDLPFGEKRNDSLYASSENQVAKVRITVFGDESLDVAFLTHIPSLSIFVDVQPDKSVVVTERLVLVLSEPQNTPFVRSYPLFYTDVDGKVHQNGMNFLWASYNKKTTNPKIQKTDSETRIIFLDQDSTSAGVHLFELSYLLPSTLFVEGNVTNFFHPLLGSSLSYPAERIEVFVAYPKETTLVKAQAFFGTNNQANEEAYDVYMDQDNHLAYKIKGILPELIDLRLNIVGDAAGFEAVQMDEKLDQDLKTFGWILLSLICSIVVFLYFHFSASDIRDNMDSNKYLSKVRSKFSYDVSMLRWLYMRKADARTLFTMVVHFLQKNLISVHFDDQEQITLIRSGKLKKGSYEKDIFSFLFKGAKKERKLSTWILNEKVLKRFRKLILKNIYRQKVLLLQREILIGALLPLITLLISIFLSYNIFQIAGELIFTFIAYMLCVNYFIRKSKLDVLMKKLFEEYIAHPLNENKQREIDVAMESGDHSNDTALLIMLKGKRLPLSEFEKMFFAQIRF